MVRAPCTGSRSLATSLNQCGILGEADGTDWAHPKLSRCVACSSRDARVLFGDSGEAVWSARATGGMGADEARVAGAVRAAAAADTRGSSTDTSSGR